MILVLRLALVAAIGLVCACHAEAADLTPPHYSAVGLASWYGSDFHGHATADGEIFDMGAVSAAHRSLPLPCYARVTNLGNGRSIVVRVNDRGPFVGGRILDVSARVAKLLEFNGITKVRVDYVGKAPPAGSDGPMLLASLQTGSAPAAAPPSPPAGFDLPALLACIWVALRRCPARPCRTLPGGPSLGGGRGRHRRRARRRASKGAGQRCARLRSPFAAGRVRLSCTVG